MNEEERLKELKRKLSLVAYQAVYDEYHNIDNISDDPHRNSILFEESTFLKESVIDEELELANRSLFEILTYLWLYDGESELELDILLTTPYDSVCSDNCFYDPWYTSNSRDFKIDNTSKVARCREILQIPALSEEERLKELKRKLSRIAYDDVMEHYNSTNLSLFEIVTDLWIYAWQSETELDMLLSTKHRDINRYNSFSDSWYTSHGKDNFMNVNSSNYNPDYARDNWYNDIYHDKWYTSAGSKRRVNSSGRSWTSRDRDTSYDTWGYGSECELFD